MASRQREWYKKKKSSMSTEQLREFMDKENARYRIRYQKKKSSGDERGLSRLDAAAASLDRNRLSERLTAESMSWSQSIDPFSEMPSDPEA